MLLCGWLDATGEAGRVADEGVEAGNDAATNEWPACDGPLLATATAGGGSLRLCSDGPGSAVEMEPAQARPEGDDDRDEALKESLPDEERPRTTRKARRRPRLAPDRCINSA